MERRQARRVAGQRAHQMAAADQGPDHMSADEPGRAGDQDRPHGRFPLGSAGAESGVRCGFGAAAAAGLLLATEDPGSLSLFAPGGRTGAIFYSLYV